MVFLVDTVAWLLFYYVWIKNGWRMVWIEVYMYYNGDNVCTYNSE